MTKHILKTGLWFFAGCALAIGIGVTDGGLIFLAGAGWVLLFS